MVMTPWSPTFSKASARSSPVVASLLAEIVAMFALSSREVMGRDWSSMLWTAAATALSMPLLRAIVLTPVAR